WATLRRRGHSNGADVGIEQRHLDPAGSAAGVVGEAGSDVSGQSERGGDAETRSKEVDSACGTVGSLGRRPPARPEIPITSVTVSSEPAEIRRSTPCPFQERFVFTDAIALDWPLQCPYILSTPTAAADTAGDYGPRRVDKWETSARGSSDARLKVGIGWIPGPCAVSHPA